MCGISGVFSEKSVNPEDVKDSIRDIAHRGPDEMGFFYSRTCVLGMCRLSIVDISSGQQPNYNESKEIVSVFNGEIYNFHELRQSLIAKGHRIRGHGDSTLIPHLYLEYGDEFPKKIQGMFAIALFDSTRNRLLLIRDRLGKKPLWYSKDGNTIFFSSEPKGLIPLGIPRKVNESLIPEFLRYGYINAPRSAYVGVHQLPQASQLSFENGKEKISQYWSASDIPEASMNFQEAKKETTRLLRDAVKARLVSERPIGAFLSGGIDSTIITALMQEESGRLVQTYSIGFADSKFDESKFAKEIANFLGTEHHERIIEPDPILIVETIAKILDQPFADPSIIPTFLLSKFAREDVVVALSGDGGDEGFGGYERYRAGKLLDSINPILVLNPIRHFPAEKFSNQRLRKLVRHSGFQTLPNRYKDIQSNFQASDLCSILNPELLEKSAEDHFFYLWNSISSKDKIRKMQEMDLNSYLPGDLMYKVDMASMANGLEIRSPFLDYRVVEFGLSIPAKYKVGRGENKHILREIAREFVPRRIIDRPKMGFAIPRAKWLREDLEELVRDVLLDEKSRSRGWYKFAQVEEILKRHKNGLELDSLIWPMFMLELWTKTWID